MEQQIFCDGIGRISVIGGVVRLDLFTYSPTEMDANGQPRPVLSHRIVMGVDGFVRSSEKVVEAVQMITRGPGEAAARAPVPLRPVPPAPPQPPAPPPPSAQQEQPQPGEAAAPSKPPFP